MLFITDKCVNVYFDILFLGILWNSMKKNKAKTQKNLRLVYGNRVNCVTNVGKSQMKVQDNSEIFMSESSSHNVLKNINQAEKQVFYSIKALRRRRILQYLAKRIKHLIPPKNVPQGIYENWQEQLINNKKQTIQTTPQSSLSLNNVQTQIGFKFSWWKILQIIQGFFLIALFWMTTIQLFFLPKAYQTYKLQSLFPFYLRCILTMTLIIKILIKQIFVISLKMIEQQIQQQKQNNQSMNLTNQESDYHINKVEDIWRPLINLLVYLLYLIVDVLFDPNDTIRYLILAFISIMLFFKMNKIHICFQPLITQIQSRNLKNQFRLFKLFFLAITLCHLIALIMFSMTYLYKDRNWLTQIRESIQENDGINQKIQNEWLKQYAYAMYWAITTIVTVGYGDITPTRFYQMVVISMIQLIGTAMFGYMINVIGLTVAQINKKNEHFDNHISTINKIANQYQLSRRLCQRFKNQIIHNQQIAQQTTLDSHQQRQFLKLISPEVKDSFTLETNIRVIKKSIYFLTHFTVNFQNQIALKLIRCIYRKGQTINILQDLNNKQGNDIKKVRAQLSIDNDIKKSENKQNFQNEQQPQRYIAIINSGRVNIDYIIKNNNMEISKPIRTIQIQDGKPTLNVFGYSSMILNKDIDLKGTVEQNAIIYMLKRKDILQCFDKNMLDFQNFIEQRQKMMQYRNLNQIQAPSLLDLTKHYIPNLYVVTKKKKKNHQIRNKQFKRHNKRTKLKLITLANYKDRTMLYIQDQPQFIDKQNSLDISANLISIPSLNNYPKTFKQTHKKNALLNNMDTVRVYQNFMVKSNINNIIKKYHKFIKKNREIRAQNEKRMKFEGIKRKLLQSQNYQQPYQDSERDITSD